MLVVWLHTFVARNGWGAGVCVCGSSTRRDLPSHRDTLADGGGLAYFGCDCEVNALTQLPGSLHEKKLTRELHFLLFLCILFLDAENPFIEGWFCFFFLYFVSFAMHISHWDNGQRNKQHIDCRCVSRQGLAVIIRASAHPLTLCADLIWSLRPRIDISPTTTVVLGCRFPGKNVPAYMPRVGTFWERIATECTGRSFRLSLTMRHVRLAGQILIRHESRSPFAQSCLHS
jgi:hypothetical protein